MNLDKLYEDTKALAETKDVKDFKAKHTEISQEIKKLNEFYAAERKKWEDSMRETLDKLRALEGQKQQLMEDARKKYNFCRANICCTRESSQTNPLPKYTTSCWACIDEQRG